MSVQLLYRKKQEMTLAGFQSFHYVTVLPWLSPEADSSCTVQFLLKPTVQLFCKYLVLGWSKFYLVVWLTLSGLTHHLKRAACLCD